MSTQSKSVHATNMKPIAKSEGEQKRPVYEPIAEELRALGIYLPALCAAKDSADSKRKLVREERTKLSGKGEKESWKDSGAVWSGDTKELTTAEHAAVRFFGWQTMMRDAEARYGTPASWKLPSFLHCLPAMFADVRKQKSAKSAKSEASPTPAPTPAPAPAPVSQ